MSVCCRLPKSNIFSTYYSGNVVDMYGGKSNSNAAHKRITCMLSFRVGKTLYFAFVIIEDNCYTEFVLNFHDK